MLAASAALRRARRWEALAPSLALDAVLHPCRSLFTAPPQQQQAAAGSGGPAASPPPAGGGGGPLAGFKVLDLGQVVAGNFCGAVLAYFGADVIKIEPPGRGDALRHLRLLDDTGTSWWWRSYGRNRRCVTADLHSEGGRRVARALAARADVLVENFRPGVAERWGLGPDDLAALNPGLVYVRISGYGQTGPKARSPGYASVCEAYAGLRAVNGYADRAPVRPNLSLGDTLAGLHAALGATMALLHRERGGRGQVVDAAITESVFNMLEGCLTEWAGAGAVRGPSGATLTGVVPSGTWRSSDGRWVVIGGNGNSVYDRLMAAVGRPDMGVANPRFATDAARWAAEGEIVAVIERWVAGRTAAEATAALEAARVPVGPILGIDDLAAEPQFAARGLAQRAAPPGGGPEATLPAMAPLLSGTPGGTRWAGPALGHHTDEVLRGELGMSADEVAALRAEGAI